ncbi:MAG: hypothetical protein QW468_06030 [Candidatus Bathyarchaeia archaeon]
MFSSDYDSVFTTFNAILIKIKSDGWKNMANGVPNEVAQQIVVDFLRKRKNTDKIDISTVEQRNGMWVVKGTCPIDLEGHPWAERFEVVVDQKGKIRSTDFALL